MSEGSLDKNSLVTSQNHLRERVARRVSQAIARE